jgi:hypothetical protein
VHLQWPTATTDAGGVGLLFPAGRPTRLLAQRRSLTREAVEESAPPQPPEPVGYHGIEHAALPVSHEIGWPTTLY